MEHIVDPNTYIYIYKTKNNNNNNIDFDFLDLLKDYININIYYYIINSLSIQTIKNIYNFIFIRWDIISNELNEKNVLEYNRKITFEEFNDIIKTFINNKYYLGIFVINSIQQYLYPIYSGSIE